MPRRGHIARRDVLPDPMYGSKTVTRLINNIMLDGKKGVAQRIVYDAFDIIKEKTGKDPVEVFEDAMNNVMPVLEVKARRVGGANYQVPIEVRPDRRETLGLRWITLFSRKRSERTMAERLANELLDATNSTGKKKTHTRWQKQTRRLHTIVGNWCVLPHIFTAYYDFIVGKSRLTNRIGAYRHKRSA